MAVVLLIKHWNKDEHVSSAIDKRKANKKMGIRCAGKSGPYRYVNCRTGSANSFTGLAYAPKIFVGSVSNVLLLRIRRGH